MHRNRKFHKHGPYHSHGFTLLEVVMAMAVAVTLAAITLPVVKTSLANYRMSAAVSTVTGAINSTRYRAIYNGYQHSLAFSKANGSTITAAQYQLGSMVPPATTFSNVGNAVPVVSPDITLNSDVTLVFSPGGKVTATTGSLTNIKLTYRQGMNDAQSRTISVSAYGNITVTNP